MKAMVVSAMIAAFSSFALGMSLVYYTEAKQEVVNMEQHMAALENKYDNLIADNERLERYFDQCLDIVANGRWE